MRTQGRVGLRRQQQPRFEPDSDASDTASTGDSATDSKGDPDSSSSSDTADTCGSDPTEGATEDASSGSGDDTAIGPMTSNIDDEGVGCDCNAGTRGAGGPLMLLGLAGLAIRRRRR